MLSYTNILNANRYIHSNNMEIPQMYRNLSLHIALEKADQNKDWNTFSKLYDLSPHFLKYHLNTTKGIYNYNYLNLPIEEQNKLFTVSDRW
jgi:hypothetical protein